MDAEAPILWPPDVKHWLIGKAPGAAKDWGQEEKGVTEDEMVGWHYQLNGHEFEQAPRDGEEQGSLACCSPWSRKESDMTEWTTTIFPNVRKPKDSQLKILALPLETLRTMPAPHKWWQSLEHFEQSSHSFSIHPWNEHLSSFNFPSPFQDFQTRTIQMAKSILDLGKLSLWYKCICQNYHYKNTWAEAVFMSCIIQAVRHSHIQRQLSKFCRGFQTCDLFKQQVWSWIPSEKQVAVFNLGKPLSCFPAY